MNPLKHFFVIFLVPLLVLAASPESPPPKDPPVVKGSAWSDEGIVAKVYTAEIDGATFRAYAVRWRGAEIIVNERPVQLSNSHKVYAIGERIPFSVTRVAPQREGTVTTLSFRVSSESRTEHKKQKTEPN
jgi:hypothetical protein